MVLRLISEEETGESQSKSKSVTIIQSSSVPERVFSLLANSFNSNQESALEDYIQTSVCRCK